jgi:PBSX family phage portal protein
MVARTEAQGSRIFKARIIGGYGGEELERLSEFPSKQLLEDPFSQIASYGVAIQRPPYSMEQLVLLAESHPPHSASLEQKAMDVIANGPKLVPEHESAPPEQEADIYNWLDEITEQQTFIELLNAVWLDYETVGWGMFEAARDINGVVQRLYHVPAHTVRAHRNGMFYVQIRNTRQVWFKRWGVDVSTGQPLRDVAVLSSNGRTAPPGTGFDKLANEMLVFVKTSRRNSWYGIPGYISGVGYITLAIAARDYNIKFFSNAREPRYIFVVSGLTGKDAEIETFMDEFEEQLKVQHKDPHRNLMVPLSGTAQFKVERLTAVQNDMHFTKLMDVTDARILEAHRMPPDRLGTVQRGMLGGNVSVAINRIYKNAVVTPAQSILCDRLGRFIRTEYARARRINEETVAWRVEFEAPDVSDETADIANAVNLVRTNMVTLNEGREKLGLPARDDMNVTLAEYLQSKGAAGAGMAMAMAQSVDMMAAMQRTQDAVLTRLEQVDEVVREVMETGEIPGGNESPSQEDNRGA